MPIIEHRLENPRKSEFTTKFDGEKYEFILSGDSDTLDLVALLVTFASCDENAKKILLITGFYLQRLELMKKK